MEIDFSSAVARLRIRDHVVQDERAHLDLPWEWGDDFVLDLTLERAAGFLWRPDALGMPAFLRASAWGDYVRALGAGFSRALGLDRCHVRLAQTSRDGCRLFHCDHLRVRVFQTLRGPGTEYVRAGDVDRSGLGRGQNDLIVRDPARIARVPTGSHFVMRGERFGAGPGVVHRSPPIEHLGLRRLCVSVDDGIGQ